MDGQLAQALMQEFADATGLSGQSPPRRYLWTDAFAVCNFLGLYRQSGDEAYLRFARDLVDQVHQVLGRHREDDPRRGWISGLPEREGELHPTRGGLRIGKPLNERQPHEPTDSQLEWDQDGQYFHYLTKWMHALNRMARETGDGCYHRWAVELAVTVHQAFTRESSRRGKKQIAWKMSIDLSRPLVSGMGHHDPLDGLITFLELQAKGDAAADSAADLNEAIADMFDMCRHAHWATDDPLGIGGLFDDAMRLARLVFQHQVTHRELLQQLLAEGELSLQEFGRSHLLRLPAGQRLPFRELGLAIGMHGLQRLSRWAAQDGALAAACNRLLAHQPLAQQIETFWSDSAHRHSRTWQDHLDINTVMLATSLAPDGYLGL